MEANCTQHDHPLAILDTKDNLSNSPCDTPVTHLLGITHVCQPVYSLYKDIDQGPAKNAEHYQVDGVLTLDILSQQTRHQ